MSKHQKIIAFDCDSTLSEIEGIDELARLCGEETLQQVEKLTNQAMNGESAIADTFAKRLELIKPGRSMCQSIGELYLDRIEPSAKKTIATLREQGWHVLIVSGGFAPCIHPLAEHLGITDVEAVPLFFDENGLYSGYDSSYPTTYNGGKTEILAALGHEHQPEKLVMVGDGVSDLEAAQAADLFIAYTGYTSRKAVTEKASHQIGHLSDCLDILNQG